MRFLKNAKCRIQWCHRNWDILSSPALLATTVATLTIIWELGHHWWDMAKNVGGYNEMELFGYPLLQSDGGDFDLVLYICELTRLLNSCLLVRKGKCVSTVCGWCLFLRSDQKVKGNKMASIWILLTFSIFNFWPKLHFEPLIVTCRLRFLGDCILGRLH